MTRIPGWAATVGILLTSGCASAPVGAAPESPTAASPSPSSIACAIREEGVELPPECIPYDPDLMRDANRRYADRMEIDADAFAAAEAVRGDVTLALEALRTADAITVDSVTAALESVGLADPQVDGFDGSVGFGVAGPQGGCLFGGATDDAVEVRVGGYILDGGCLPAVGH